MKKLLLFFIYTIIPTICFSQAVKQNEKFAEVPVVQGKVIFLKEIPLKKNISKEENYEILKKWATVNYNKNPFISSVRHDPKNHEFIVKSREELILPANSKGAREKIVMRYRINGFLFQDKCVMEITEIAFMTENNQNKEQLSKFIRAEDFITNEAISIKDEIAEYRINTRIVMLEYLNKIAKDFENQFRH